MKNVKKEIMIDGIKYVPESSIKKTEMVQSKKGMNYCIVRTYSAGVFAGWVKNNSKGKERTVYDARRIWYWEGASSLSELAMKGTSKPEKCKFPVAVVEVKLMEVIEIIKCSKQGKESIEAVKEWKQNV